MKSIGKIIRTYRLKRELTTAALAEALGVPEKMVIRWEKGTKSPDAEQMQQLSGVLDIPACAWVSATARAIRAQNRALLITGIALLLVLVLALGSIGMSAKQIWERMEYVLYGGFGSLAGDYAVSVSMAELIATPERYHGVRVRVIAVGNLEFEGDCLSISKEAWENHTNDQIWIELGEELSPYYERLQRYNGEYVIVEGVFNMYDKGTFGMFQGTLHDVSRYEFDQAHLYNNCVVYYGQNEEVSYTVYDNDGNAMMSGRDLGSYPQTRYVGVDVLGLFLANSEYDYDNQAVYFDLEKSIVSEPFSHVIEAQDRYVVYVTESEGQYNVIVQDIFDPAIYYKTYPLENYNPDAERPIMSQKDDVSGKVEICYKSGENQEEKTLTVYLP